MGPRGRAWGPQIAAAALALAVVAGGAPRADAEDLRSVGDLDGVHLFVGPVGAATHVGGAWDSAWGGSLVVARIREGAPLSAAGAWLGAAHYGASEGGRVWLDAIAGTRRLVGLRGTMIGIGLGPVVELGTLQHPRFGAQGSIWCFAGVVPYARLGVLDASGSFVELGVSLSIPALRF